MKITLDNVTIAIANKCICQNLSLQLSPGETWAVLGPNGIGKTTLLHTLIGLRQPEQGQVLLNDVPLSHYSAKTIASHIGILLQNQEYTFANTVFDTIYSGAYANALSKRTVTKNILQIAKELKLTELLSRSITKLSGGEKRRVDFATLLLQAPQLYLLDEPTNHLDIKHQQHVLRTSKKLASQGNTVMISTHDINLAHTYCDKIIMLFGNGVTAVGNTDIILHENNLLNLYQHPLKKITFEDKTYWTALH